MIGEWSVCCLAIAILIRFIVTEWRTLGSAPVVPCIDGLQRLGERYVAGELDLIDYLLAVDAWPSAPPSDPDMLDDFRRLQAINERVSGCSNCFEVVTGSTGKRWPVCSGNCAPVTDGLDWYEVDA